MKLIHKLDRYITVGFIITIVAVVLTSYYTFKEVISAHHDKYQQAIVPLFSLINTEIIRPLSIAKFMAKNEPINQIIESETLDKALIVKYLKTIDSSYGLRAFIAIEKHNTMLSSGIDELSLNDDKNEWYHRLKNMPQIQFTDIGNADDPHLYFDHKILSDSNEFLGFTGVAIDLTYFAKTFEHYNNRFGFELFFVNNNNEVMLSSTKLMRTDSHHRKDDTVTIDTLPWFQEYSKVNRGRDKTKDVISFDNKKSVITSMPLKDLQWRVFVIYPPAADQSEYWQLFISRFSIFLLFTFVLYGAFIIAVQYMKRHLLKDSETDYLTELPNRSYIHWKFEQLPQQCNHLSVVVADIDHFKRINDEYGHLVGDDIIKVISTKLSENLRKDDVTGRWGGEEFIMLLPNTSAAQAFEIIERIREDIAQTSYTVNKSNQSIKTTVSFGISESPIENMRLVDIIEKADKALYQAKSNGRNQAVIYKN